jgi:hypothetical protein
LARIAKVLADVLHKIGSRSLQQIGEFLKQKSVEPEITDHDIDMVRKAIESDGISGGGNGRRHESYRRNGLER